MNNPTTDLFPAHLTRQLNALLDAFYQLGSEHQRDGASLELAAKIAPARRRIHETVAAIAKSIMPHQPAPTSTSTVPEEPCVPEPISGLLDKYYQSGVNQGLAHQVVPDEESSRMRRAIDAHIHALGVCSIPPVLLTLYQQAAEGFHTSEYSGPDHPDQRGKYYHKSKFPDLSSLQQYHSAWVACMAYVRDTLNTPTSYAAATNAANVFEDAALFRFLDAHIQLRHSRHDALEDPAFVIKSHWIAAHTGTRHSVTITQRDGVGTLSLRSALRIIRHTAQRTSTKLP